MVSAVVAKEKQADNDLAKNKEKAQVVESTPKVVVQGENSPQYQDFEILNPTNKGDLLDSVKERDLTISNSNPQQQNPSHSDLIAVDTCIVDIPVILAAREEKTSHDAQELEVEEEYQKFHVCDTTLRTLQQSLIKEIQSLMGQYWWGGAGDGKKLHWKSWNKLCESKKKGGLGFRNLKNFNWAMLAKQTWRILTKDDSLLYRILKAKYFSNSLFWEAIEKTGASFTRRGILQGRKLLSHGVTKRVGRGDSIRIWKH
ncbi:hypothetical protein ACH5RR_018178 [Cinchona calisaya]|uniref:Uncharacterized protein n=1 Tax=Cinchona calisaya TaxID=153742 RepID=A0ABD2ZLA5_9GENT